MKTSLGIWAFGPMVTRFVPGGYQPEHAADEPTAEKVHRAVTGLGDLIDDYEFHYPQELSPDNLDEVRDGARRPRHLLLAAGLHLDPRFGRGGLSSPDDAVRAEALRLTLEAADFAGQLGAHFISGPESRATTTRSRRPTARAGRWFIDGIGEAAERCKEHGVQAVPRAQELRARDEDPHAQHRHDAARHPQAARPRGSTTSRSTWTGSTCS